MEVQTALSAHTEPQGVNARAGTGPWKCLLSIPSARGSQLYWEMLQAQGRLEGLSCPCLREGAAELEEAQVRLGCLCTSSEHQLRTALLLVLG